LGHWPWGDRHGNAGRVVPMNVLVYVLAALIALSTVGARATAGGSVKTGSGPVAYDLIMPTGG
jgi:hypothetical protein